MNKKKISLAVLVSLSLVVPWMILDGDLGTGEARDWMSSSSHYYCNPISC